MRTEKVLMVRRWPVLVIASVAVVGVLAWRVTEPTNPEDQAQAFEVAQQRHRAGDDAEALVAYRALAEDGHVGAGCFAQVVANRLDGKGSKDALESMLAELVRQEKKDVWCETLYARELVHAGDAPYAEERLDLLAAEHPNLSFVHESLAYAQFRQHGYERAAESFVKASSLRPDNAVLEANAGYAYFLYGNYSKARPHYEAAQKLGLQDEAIVERVKDGLDVIDGGKWICPMHADEIGEHGGKCGKCKMDLEPADRMTRITK